MGGWSAAHLARAVKTAGLTIEIALDGPPAIESGELPPEADENFIPIEEIGEVEPSEMETDQDIEDTVVDDDEEAEKEAQVQAYQLGMQWAFKEAGVLTPIRRQALLELARGVATQEIKTAEDMRKHVAPAIDRTLEKLAADEGMLEKELKGVPEGLRLALLAGGGAGLGALGGAGASSLKELLLGQNQDPEAAASARRRLMLIGALGGGGLGLYKHLDMDGQAPEGGAASILNQTIRG